MFNTISRLSKTDLEDGLPGLFGRVPIISGNYRFFLVSNYAYIIAFVMHLLFIPLFWFFGVSIMALYNLGSITAFFIAFIFNRKGFHDLAWVIGAAAICLHAALSTYSVGWQSGFFVYILAMVPLVFFNPAWNHGIKVAISVFFATLYICLKIYSDSHIPLVVLPQSYTHLAYYINGIFIFILLGFLSYFYSLAAIQSESALQRSYNQIQVLARTDPLTKLANRRETIDVMDKEVSRFNRTNKAFAVILADIDNFKVFNDKYGHDCGDFVLITVANTMKRILRDNDHVGRWGGEEFLIILPGTNKEEARYVAEKIRCTLHEKSFTFRNIHCHITMTFGICIYDGKDSVEACLRRADKSLYRGKESGKNCVVATSARV